MKQNLHVLLLSIVAGIAFIMVSSCQSDKKETSNKAVHQILQDAPAEVTTASLKLIDLEHQLVSNVNINAQIVA
jgi:hypothetical protein